MKKLIEKAQKELTRRILAEEYELISLEKNRNIGYICEAVFKVDEYRFKYSIAETYICDHSEIQILQDTQPVIDHFIKKFEEKFNTEEIKQAEIKRLEEEIKQLKNK